MPGRRSDGPGDGKVHVGFEQHDTMYRPEDVTIRARKNGSEDVLSSLMPQNADSCSTTYDCWDTRFSTEEVTLPDLGVHTLDVAVREGRQNNPTGLSYEAHRPRPFPRAAGGCPGGPPGAQCPGSTARCPALRGGRSVRSAPAQPSDAVRSTSISCPG
ncbi:hypothetical protein [Streptomyces sp. NPDC005953]|uniref:hypothetical protein n=1 Tax=Streptomyces sp. NPDC005953 TaxID=3156719 RepID=UPI0033F40D79